MASQKKLSEQKEINLLEDFTLSTYEEWREAVDNLLKGAPFEKVMITPTYEGIKQQPMYRQEDVADITHPESWPGFAPFVRGNRAAGYLSKSWYIAQEIPASTPAAFNEALQHDMAYGQTAVNLTIDNATAQGLDSDQSSADAIGVGGLTLSTLDDLQTALNGIDLESTAIYIKAPGNSVFLSAFLAALCNQQQIPLQALQGCIGYDPLTELLEKGKLPTSLAQAYREMAILTRWVNQQAPGLQTIAIHADVFRNGGGSAVQELGFAVAIGVEYIRELLNRELKIDQVAPQIRFTFALGSNFFMEIAKLRAARMVWEKIIAEFGGNQSFQKMRVHARSSMWNKTTYDPYVNMLRTTTEALSGILGGCDSMHTMPFDATVRQPDEFSRRIARNTQIILKEEAHFDRVIDAAGGSWYVEALTAEIAENAWKLFQQVEEHGGMVQAMQGGFPQQQIAEIAQQKAENIARRKNKFIGANIYPNLSEKPLEDNQPDYPAIYKQRVAFLKKFRSDRDKDKLESALESLSQNANTDGTELMESLIAAAFAKATLGEMAEAIRPEREQTPAVEPLRFHRATEMFENLRKAMEDYKNRTGTEPSVFLANMGPVSQHKARADFSSGFFRIAGFNIITNAGFDSPQQAAQAAIKSKAPIVVICSTDDTYPELVPPITRQIKQASPETIVIVAGYPKAQIENFKTAGVDEFIHIRANAYEILHQLMTKTGVLT